MMSFLNLISLLLAVILISVSIRPTEQGRPNRPSTLNSYLAQRRSLLRSQEASDFQSDAPALNRRERLANDIIMAEKRSVLAAGLSDPDNFAPAQHFFDVIDSVRETRLFRLIQRLPKGGILHGHDTAMASIDYLVSLTYWEHLWHCTDARTERITSFRFAREQPADGNGCAWQSTATVRSQRGAQTFDAFVRTHFTMRHTYPSKDANEWWTSFEGIFGLVGGLVTYVPAWRDNYRQVLLEALADNVQYVEFRTVMPQLYELDGTVVSDHVEIVQMFVEVEAEVREEYPTKFIGSKMMYAPHRAVSNATIERYMTEVQRLQAAFPRFVAGFDLVGQEDAGRTLLSVAEWLLRLPESVRFFFHAGETNWSGSEVDENLYDAILLGTQRIGHGFALAKHPQLLQLVKRRNIAVEINPVSNQVSMMVDDMRNHPAAVYFAQNLPLVVSSDDPQMWEALPLSDDFHQTFVGIVSAHSDLRTLKKLALNSIRYSAMSAAEKRVAIRKWEAEWALFVEAVIAGEF